MTKYLTFDRGCSSFDLNVPLNSNICQVHQGNGYPFSLTVFNGGGKIPSSAIDSFEVSVGNKSAFLCLGVSSGTISRELSRFDGPHS